MAATLNEDSRILGFVDTAYFVEYGFLSPEVLLKKRNTKYLIINLLKQKTMPYAKAYDEFTRILNENGISKMTVNKVLTNNLLV